MQKITVQLETLTCPTCAKKIQNVLQKLQGVLTVEVIFSLSKVLLKVEESKQLIETVEDVIRRLGYGVVSMKIQAYPQ